MEPIKFPDYDTARAYGLKMRDAGYRARIRPRGGQWEVVLREKKSSPALTEQATVSEAVEVEEEFEAPSPPRISKRPRLQEPMDLSALRAPSPNGMPGGAIGEPLSSLATDPRSIRAAGERLKWQPGLRKSGVMGEEAREEEHE